MLSPHPPPPQKASVTSFQGRTLGSQAPPGWLLAAEGTDRWLESAEERDWGVVLVLEEMSLWGSQTARPSRQGTPLQPLALGLGGNWCGLSWIAARGVCF